MSDNSTLKYIGIYTGDKEQAPTNASEYSWTKIKVDGKLYKAYSNSLNGTDFTLVEPDENAKLFAKNRPRVNIVNDNDISDIWQANMFLSFKPNTKYTLTARAKGNNNKLWAYFRNNKTSEQYSWGQLEFRGLETKSITFTTTNDVEDVLFKFVLVPEDEDWTGIQIDWFTIYEGDKRYTDYPVDEPAQYHKYRYFGYVFKEGTPVASDFEWFDLQQTSITNDKYTHIVYSDNADGSNFGREPKKYMGVARTTSPTQPTDKTAYKWFKVKGEDGVDGKSINRNYIVDSEKLTNINGYGTNWEKSVENGTLVFTKVRATENTGFWTQIMPFLKDNFQNEEVTWSLDVKASKNISFNNVGQETNGFKGRVDLTTQWQRISHTFTNRYTQFYSFVFYQMIGTCSPGDKIYIRLPKLEKGNIATEWSPAYEDLQAHSLTANLRFEGTYINNLTNNVNAYLDVFYDGQKVDNGFNVQLKDKGGTRTDWSDFWNSNVNNGLLSINKNWKNGTQNGQPLELIALVTYKGLNTIANARLENIPDVVEIKEITKKYKTFESTIDQFNSTIGEVKQQVLANEEKRNLVLGSRMLSESDYKKIGNTVELDLHQEYQGLPYLSIFQFGKTSKVWQGVGFDLSLTRINKGEIYSIRIPMFVSESYQPDEGAYLEIKNHDTREILWQTRLDTNKYPIGSWNTHEYTFTASKDMNISKSSFWIFHVKNGYLAFAKPYMCEGDTLPKNYSPAPEDFYLQNSRIESSIIQTKNEIKSAVTENNFGTVLTQNATSLRLAWNNISNYVQFENGGMSFYEGTVTRNKLRARIDDGTYSFWRDGYQVGSMGTGVVHKEEDKKGLSFFLDRDGTYMAWSYRNDNNNDKLYAFKWMYTRQAFGGYEADTLNAGCNVDFGWNEIKKLKIHSNSLDVKDGITGTFNVKTDIGEETMVFKNGLLVSGR